MTRTRFSPSPTGMIHIGNARTALFSALLAKHDSGTFILRIEDTDQERSDEKYTESLQDNLHWFGVFWQEGPKVGGDYGPYWQSQRQDIYAEYYKELEEKGLIYPCFCSDSELNLARKIQLSRGQAPRYGKTCLKLSKEQIEKNIADGKKPAWRFSVPDNKTIEFTDYVKGPQKFLSNDIGDFIVRRGDGTSPFLFCNAIDDATMKVSHVMRGEDHIANTPRQLMILEALKLHTPQYGHLSLIVGDDGAPLSKRHGSFSLNQLHDEGYLPVAIMNYLSRLGHACDTQELLDFDGLAKHFQVNKLSVSPARFDVSQLVYWQKCAIQAMDNSHLALWLGEKVLNQVPQNKHEAFINAVRANVIFPHDGHEWADIFFNELVTLTEEDAAIIKQAGEQYFVEAEQAIAKYGEDVQQAMAEMKTTLQVSGKKLFMPFRIALTGRQHGPELATIASILGKEKMCKRLSQAFKLASK